MTKNLIKLGFGYLIAIVMVLVFFTSASYGNTFRNLYGNMLIKFVSFFACSLLLRQYFTKGQAIAGTLLYIGLFLYVLTPYNAYRLNINLPAYCFCCFGFVLGYFFRSIGVFKKIAFIGLVTAFAYFNTAFIYPRFVLNRISNKDFALKSNMPIKTLFSNVSLIKGDTNFIMPATGNTVYLIDFFFNNCAPCRAKEPYVLQVEKAVNDTNFEVLYIESGKYDTYEVYKKNYGRLLGKVLYDKGNQLSDSLKIDGYPFEIILDKKGIVRYVSAGFDNSTGVPEKYVQQTKEKIQQLLYE
jgi:thiol-disulfide isomerase/thioredoxin